MGQLNSEASAEDRLGEPMWGGGLRRLVEADIIPRLMLLYAAPPAYPELDDEELATFFASLRSPDPSATQAQVARLLASGILVENLIAQLIAPALAWLDEVKANKGLDLKRHFHRAGSTSTSDDQS